MRGIKMHIRGFDLRRWFALEAANAAQIFRHKHR